MNEQAYAVSSLPTTVLIDEEGRVVAYGVGIEGTEEVVTLAKGRLAAGGRAGRTR